MASTLRLTGCRVDTNSDHNSPSRKRSIKVQGHRPTRRRSLTTKYLPLIPDFNPAQTPPG